MHFHRPPPAYDWAYDYWGDDCPPPYRERSPSVAALPHPRADAPKSLPCAPDFGINRNWLGDRCAKLHESEAPAFSQPATSQPATAPQPAAPSKPATAPGPATASQPTTAPGPATAPVSAPPCSPNLGVNRNWLDSRCAKLDESVTQTVPNIDTKSVHDFFSSLVAPIDLRAYRIKLEDWTFDIILVVLAAFIVLVCARLVNWIFNEQSRPPERQERSQLLPLTPERFPEDVRSQSDALDPRSRQAKELADRTNQLQNAIFGQP